MGLERLGFVRGSAPEPGQFHNLRHHEDAGHLDLAGSADFGHSREPYVPVLADDGGQVLLPRLGVIGDQRLGLAQLANGALKRELILGAVLRRVFEQDAETAPGVFFAIASQAAPAVLFRTVAATLAQASLAAGGRRL